MLAKTLGLPFVDGDDLHPPSNVDKMSRGIPLTDEDRQPWLDSIRKCIVDQDGDGPPSRGIVVACSALKKTYRDILRGRNDPAESAVSTYFVFLQGSQDLLLERLQKRTGHFMKAQMLESQLATLENPCGESGVVTVPVEWSTEEQVQHVAGYLERVHVVVA